MKLLLSISCLLMSSAVLAVTYTPSMDLSPENLIKIESLIVTCGEPEVDCPKLPLDDIIGVQYFEAGEEIVVGEGDELQPKIFEEDGILVIYVGEGKEGNVMEIHRFFPMEKVGLSPDEEFYLCERGAEVKVDFEKDISEIEVEPSTVEALFTEDYKPQSFYCHCFWMPRRVFDDLGIEKKIKDKKPLQPEDPDIIKDLNPGNGSPVFDPILGSGSPFDFFDFFYPFGRNTYWGLGGGGGFVPGEKKKKPFTPDLTPTSLPQVPIGGKRCGFLPLNCLFNRDEPQNYWIPLSR